MADFVTRLNQLTAASLAYLNEYSDRNDGAASIDIPVTDESTTESPAQPIPKPMTPNFELRLTLYPNGRTTDLSREEIIRGLGDLSI